MLRYLFFILCLFSSWSLACSLLFKPLEQTVQIVEGIGGSCYYKRVPQPENVGDWARASWRETAWRSEFYLNIDATKPNFVLQGRYERDILCGQDAQGNDAIIQVRRERNFVSDSAEPYENHWLSFYINDTMIKGYAPIKLIQREENRQGGYGGDCGYQYLLRENGFVQDSQGRYRFEVLTFDRRRLVFDVLTGEQIPVEQSPEVRLRQAVHAGNLDTVEVALAAGADPNLGTIEGTPLHLAANYGYLSIAQRLIDAGAELDYRRSKVKERCGSDGACNTYSASFDIIESDTRSPVPHHPLFMAVYRNNQEMLELLLANGADPNIRSFMPFLGNKTALEGARMLERTDLEAYLIEKGAME